MMATIRVGFTRSDRATGYSSFDGYREGAEQDLVDIVVKLCPVPVETIAEAVFEATNAPYPVPGLAGDIRAALYDLPVRSLSVGDTVEVAGNRVAVEPVGFRRVNGTGR